MNTSLRIEKNNLTAFTLAEILIVIAIIGIIAAMTLSALITNYNKDQTIVKLKPAISTINQAYMMSFSEKGDPGSQEAYKLGNEKYFRTYWAPYLKSAVLCKTYQQCGYKSPTPWTDLKGHKNTYIVSPSERTTFYTSNGYLYVIFTHANMDDIVEDIAVDINGAKTPNTFGKDVFWLTRDNGRIEPYEYNLDTNTIDKECKSTGKTCAAKIVHDGWQITKNYPW